MDGVQDRLQVLDSEVKIIADKIDWLYLEKKKASNEAEGEDYQRRIAALDNEKKIVLMQRGALQEKLVTGGMFKTS